MDIRFIPCQWKDIEDLVAARLRERRALVESFWEEHVLTANHYQILCGGETAGYFAIHGKELLVLFDVLPQFAQFSQEIFSMVKKYETVKTGFVVTDDTFFLSHCADNFARIEKQAYFSRYLVIPGMELGAGIAFRLLSIHEDRALYEKCGEIITPEELLQMANGSDTTEVYQALRDGVDVGVGVLREGRIIAEYASIGMLVHPEHRRQGNATAILRGLQAMARDRGLTPVSGCWYYNHNSKKSLEAAGAYCPVRLLRFEF